MQGKGWLGWGKGAKSLWRDAESVEELSGVVDEDGNTRPNQAMVKEVQAALFGPKIYGDKEVELGDLIAHSIEKYSEKKEKQGKSAEE